MDNNRHEAFRWFHQSQRDLKAAHMSLKTGSYEWACFQSQQAAEKALKSVLILTGRRRIVKHSLLELLLETGKMYPVILELKKGIKSLEGAYFTSRYPDSIAGDMIPGEYYEEEDGCECIQYAESILEKIRLILNE